MGEMKCTTWVVARLTVPGIHCWASQPDGAARRYLATPHRHLFHIEAGVKVGGDDREIECFALRGEVEHVLRGTFPPDSNGEAILNSSSCEMVAAVIGDHLRSVYGTGCYCEVLEDGEVGARKVWS
jgi:hypothetical protein